MKVVCMSLLLLAVPAAAQVQVEDRTSREQAIQGGQRKATAAYRELQQAQYEAKLAEQEYLNAQEAHRISQQQTDGRRREMDAAKKALDAARAKEARARKSYNDALSGVDRAWQKPPANQKSRGDKATE